MKRIEKLREILRFGITGGICFVVEFVILVILRDTVGLDTLIATPIAFTISVIVNYLLCIIWVFKDTKEQNRTVKAGFFLTSIIGLFLNELFMLLFRVLFGEDTIILSVSSFSVSMYMMNKALATLLVMLWNYFTKRAMLTKHKA